MAGAGFPLLFSPLRVGALRLPNRVVLSAMTTGFGFTQGAPEPEALAYYRTRSRGTALATVGFGAVAPEGRVENAIAWLWPDGAAAALAPLAAAIASTGARPAIQLGHGGRQVSPAVIGEAPVAPSAVAAGAHVRVAPRSLGTDEVAEIVAAFGAAAQRATDAGFEAVEVHAGHGYLIQQFLAAESNRRNDRYGGATVTARSRFGCEVIEAVRRAAPEAAVVVRVNGADLVPGGMQPDDAVVAAGMFAEAGADAFVVSAGVYGSVPWTIPLLDDAEGVFCGLAAEVRRNVDVPVIAVGRITTPEAAEAALAGGQCDAVALGRALLADEDWVAKARAGRAEEIRPCIATVQGCAGRLQYGEAISCTVNPDVGRELHAERLPDAAGSISWGGRNEPDEYRPNQPAPPPEGSDDTSGGGNHELTTPNTTEGAGRSAAGGGGPGGTEGTGQVRAGGGGPGRTDVAGRVLVVGGGPNATEGAGRAAAGGGEPGGTDVAGRVLVVGGGPAGMEAARRAAQLGYAVQLLEREDRLGGALNLAAATPALGHFARLVTWYEDELQRPGVTVALGSEIASADDLAGFEADHVVIATGARTAPEVLDGYEHLPAWTLEELLAGGPSTLGIWHLSDPVVVLGGGSRALAIALWCRRAGYRVSLLTSERLGHDTAGLTRRAYLSRLAPEEGGIVQGQAVRITPQGVEWTAGDGGGEAGLLPARSLVVAEPTRPSVPTGVAPPGANGQGGAVGGSGPATLRIGDARTPRTIGDAIAEARQVVESLPRSNPRPKV